MEVDFAKNGIKTSCMLELTVKSACSTYWCMMTFVTAFSSTQQIIESTFGSCRIAGRQHSGSDWSQQAKVKTAFFSFCNSGQKLFNRHSSHLVLKIYCSLSILVSCMWLLVMLEPHISDSYLFRQPGAHLLVQWLNKFNYMFNVHNLPHHIFIKNYGCWKYTYGRVLFFCHPHSCHTVDEPNSCSSIFVMHQWMT